MAIKKVESRDCILQGRTTPKKYDQATRAAKKLNMSMSRFVELAVVQAAQEAE